MTKEQLFSKWDIDIYLKADIDAVIANEIAKAKEQPQPEPTEQPSSQVILDNSFDKDRFEAMFRAVLASWEFDNITEVIEQTEYNLNKLDAYYASKEGGNNE